MSAVAVASAAGTALASQAVVLAVLVLAQRAGIAAVDYPWFWAACTWWDCGSAVLRAGAGDFSDAAGDVIAAAACAVAWWLSRRNRRDRARRRLGAKSRALRDALVRKAREVSVPRLVLAPGGAR